jgi:hypothetical protein
MYKVLGQGAESCGTWTAAHGDANQFVLAQGQDQWVVGFLSGVGWEATDDPAGYTDLGGVSAWVTNYCAAHPTYKIVNAAAAFVLFMRVNPKVR